MSRFARALAMTAAALALLIAPAAASTSPPYIVEVAGQSTTDTAFSGSAGSVGFAYPLVSMSCSSATWSGTVLAGDTSANPGGLAHIADLTSSTWNGCLGPLGIPLTYQQQGTWRVLAVGTATAGGSDVLPGYIDNFRWYVHQTGNPGACTHIIEGRALGYFNENTQEFVINQPQANSTLRVTSVTGCYGLMRLNDPVSLIATVKLGKAGSPATPLPLNLKPTP